MRSTRVISHYSDVNIWQHEYLTTQSHCSLPLPLPPHCGSWLCYVRFTDNKVGSERRLLRIPSIRNDQDVDDPHDEDNNKKRARKNQYPQEHHHSFIQPANHLSTHPPSQAHKVHERVRSCPFAKSHSRSSVHTHAHLAGIQSQSLRITHLLHASRGGEAVAAPELLRAALVRAQGSEIVTSSECVPGIVSIRGILSITRNKQRTR